MTYSTVPSASKFQSDSSVAFATRKHDIVLHRIDGLLEARAYTKDAAKRFIFLSDLYFTTDYWLKMFTGNPTVMLPKREKAVHALFTVCAFELCKFFGCTINGLPRELEFMWGRTLTDCGAKKDFVDRCAKFLTRAEASIYRLWFKGGRAYMLPWYQTGGDMRQKVVANSKWAYSKEAQTRNGKPADDYGFFVLTMSRDLYMAKHFGGANNSEKGFYHSAYVAGEAVACSGTMLIQEGVVKKIRTNSGHYQPHANNVRTLIMALRMWGVPLDGVIFEDLWGNPLVGQGTINDVLKATNDFTNLKNGFNKTVGDSKKGFDARPQPDMSKVPSGRDWMGNRPYQQEARPPAQKTF